MSDTSDVSEGHRDASPVHSVKVRVVDYVNADAADAREVAMMAEIVEGSPELDLLEGAIIMVMTTRPRDANRTVKDLMAGADGFDVPRCPPGSEIEFTGIAFVNYDGITYADGFKVIQAVPESAPGP